MSAYIFVLIIVGINLRSPSRLGFTPFLGRDVRNETKFSCRMCGGFFYTNIQGKDIMERKFTVYKHTFPNGKMYIGITSTKPDYRWNGGKGYKRQAVYNAIRKYGWDNIGHEILFENLTELEAKEKEKDLIKVYQTNKKEFGYNLTEGGDGTCGIAFTVARRKRVSASNMNRAIGVETKRKLRDANIGKIASKDTKRKMSESKMGERNAFYGKHHSDLTKKKIAEANSGFNNKKAMQIGRYDMNGNLIEIHGSFRSAEKHGFQRRKFGKVINDLTFIESNGFLWKLA